MKVLTYCTNCIVTPNGFAPCENHAPIRNAETENIFSHFWRKRDGSSVQRSQLVIKRQRLNNLSANKKKKKIVCVECGKVFSNSSHLKIHKRTHTGEKPYACDKCSMRFAQSVTLQGHLRTHTGEKPYSCKTCGRCFAQSSTLTKHKRIHKGTQHLDYNCKKYKKLRNSCEKCGKSFPSAFQLIRHQVQTHVDKTRSSKIKESETAKPTPPQKKLWYPCDKCGELFPHALKLIRHEQTHIDKNKSGMNIINLVN